MNSKLLFVPEVAKISSIFKKCSSSIFFLIFFTRGFFPVLSSIFYSTQIFFKFQIFFNCSSILNLSSISFLNKYSSNSKYSTSDIWKNLLSSIFGNTRNFCHLRFVQFVIRISDYRTLCQNIIYIFIETIDISSKKFSLMKLIFKLWNYESKVETPMKFSNFLIFYFFHSL